MREEDIDRMEQMLDEIHPVDLLAKMLQAKDETDSIFHLDRLADAMHAILQKRHGHDLELYGELWALLKRCTVLLETMRMQMNVSTTPIKSFNVCTEAFTMEMLTLMETSIGHAEQNAKSQLEKFGVDSSTINLNITTNVGDVFSGLVWTHWEHFYYQMIGILETLYKFYRDCPPIQETSQALLETILLLVDLRTDDQVIKTYLNQSYVAEGWHMVVADFHHIFPRVEMLMRWHLYKTCDIDKDGAIAIFNDLKRNVEHGIPEGKIPMNLYSVAYAQFIDVALS